MPNRFMSVTPALVSVLFFPWATRAEPALPPEQETSTIGQFDPRDFSGIWYRRGGHRSINEEVPTMTPEGEAMLNTHIPARGRNLSEPLNGEHYSRVRAVVPALSNDPMMVCNPQGFPRLLLDPEPIEFLHIGAGRILQFFQWESRRREIWTDGRELPTGEALYNRGTAWYGYSVGDWEGDTLVVNTVGFDERAWVDMYGMPYTFDARIEERYRRVDADTIELHMTLYDPAIYTEPWVSDTKIFRREPRENYTFFGWYGFSGGIMEGICAPLDEVDNFNSRIRDPAGGGVD